MQEKKTALRRATFLSSFETLFKVSKECSKSDFGNRRVSSTLEGVLFHTKNLTSLYSLRKQMDNYIYFSFFFNLHSHVFHVKVGYVVTFIFSGFFVVCH